MLLNEDGCGWSALNPSEHDFLFEFITVLNDRVRKSAREAGINFWAEGLFAFKDSRICDGGPDDTVMNFFNAVPPQGRLLDRVNPTNWVHGTFHPKPSGHQAIADELEPWLEDLLERIDVGLQSANPKPNPDASFRIRQVSSIETVLVNTEDLPTSLSCEVERVSAFGTLLPLMDAEEGFALNASPDEPVCYTRPTDRGHRYPET